MTQFEREMMLERQREGIAKAKAAGKYKGRASVSADKIARALELNNNGATATEAAKELALGRSTVYRLLKEHG